MISTKSETQNGLAAPGHNLRCAVSEVLPHTDHVVEKKQLQLSHQIVFS